MSTTEPPRRHLLIMAAPPPGKLPKDMTEAERRAWADSIFDRMKATYHWGKAAES